MATNYTTFYDDVMPVAPGAPLVLVAQEVKFAAIEFFAKSLCHQQALTPFNAVVGTADYTLTPPANTVIEQVLEVTFNNGLPLRPVRRVRDLHAIFGPGWDALPNATPTYFYVNPQATSIKLIAKPNATSSIAILAAVKPTMASTSISDDDLYQQHRLTIAEGAKWRILRMPRKPWSNPDLANQCYQLFQQGCQAALVKAMSGQSQSTGVSASAGMEASKAAA